MRNYMLEMSRSLIKAIDLLDKLFQQTFVIVSVMREVRQLLLDQLGKVEEEMLLSQDEMASKLRVSRRTIDHWTQIGKLDSYRIGNKSYYKFGECVRG